ncbi:sugar-binding transcriptional regulator [Limoniibacter endophyticus]|uniref:Sugar-binding protein n=1 Tax=Limoniibacter endophyticus TaxID=1565040 RepID=A0A8J3GGQ2_9HYPH|nr:sugar-binding transcriptional regulator [Limoniibacter endophyticus]GHC70229.1 sugar-binding protein [Limoniibacter endophyticus]
MAAKTKGKRHQKSVLASSDLNVKMAWLYYVEGFTQEEIARRLNISRVKVMRALAQAAADNIVVTTINTPSSEQVILERKLEEGFGLDSAIVVPAPLETDHLEKSIGHAVALYLDAQMKSGMTLAIGGGATMHASLAFMAQRTLENALVIGLVGSLPHSRWVNPSIVATKVAERLGVESYQITAPVVLDDAALRDRLWKQPMLQVVAQCAAEADIAVLTVGDLSPDSTIFRHGIVDPALIEPLKAQGAVANMLCYFVDAEGKLVDHEINDRVMAIDLETVSKVPQLILAAGGENKVEAIRAALKGMDANVLITDAETAKSLLTD